MVFNFYLYNPSFECIDDLTCQELGIKIENLTNTCTDIRSNFEFIYRNDSIYDVNILKDKKIHEILYDPDDHCLTVDQKKALSLIIDHCKSSELNSSDLLNILKTHSQNEVYGLICLHTLVDIEEIYLIRNSQDWINFHRYFLQVYPISETHFYEECIKSFPNIYFHEGVKNSLKTLEGGLFIFCKAISSSLIFLNDQLMHNFDYKNVQESIKKCSSACPFEITLEGNMERKKDLSFTFLNADSIEEEIYCEPHIKLHKSDKPGDSHYYFNRIYFHGCKLNIKNNRVLVGHIGKHL